MDALDIQQTLESLATAREKIDYLESIPADRRGHTVRYTLASLYLEERDTGRAEDLLKDDLKSVEDVYERYESYSLLMGIYMDQKREIAEGEIERMVMCFDRMRANASEELEKLRERAREGDTPSGAARGRPHRTRGVAHGNLSGARKFQIYVKDPYQFERMMGDFYYKKGDFERAYSFYERYYRDLDKPVETFVPESMRWYADTLLKRRKTEEALFFLGYIIALKPYMFEDIFEFAELYHTLGDAVSALVILMFAYTLAEGYSRTHMERARELVEKVCAEAHGRPLEDIVKDLARTHLSSDPAEGRPRITGMLPMIESLKKEGIRNFFFSYLEGIAWFAMEDYGRALTRFVEFNEIYPFLAESHYYALACTIKTDPDAPSRRIADLAEKAIGLKPESPLAQMARMYLGAAFGIPAGESAKILVSSEAAVILGRFLYENAPPKVLDRLIGSLTIRSNPYQAEAVRLMAKVNRRQGEFCAYLKNVCDLLNETGRRHIRKVLESVGGAAG